MLNMHLFKVFKIQFFIIFALMLITIAEKPKCPPMKRNDLCRAPAREQNKSSLRGSIPPEGYYPWYAAIYHNRADKILFRCAGSIISKNAILTSQPCFLNAAGDTIANNELLVQVGSNKKYLCGKFFKVSFKTTSDFFDKMAVIVLQKSIKFTNLIRPICFERNNIVDVLRSQHWVPGWDKKSMVGSELIHQKLEASMRNQNCIASNDIYRDCDRDRDGIKNCLVSSGTALTYQINGQWFIRGVALTTIYAEKDKNFTACNDHVWFDDINKNYDWITNTLKSLEENNLCHAHLRDNDENVSTEIQMVPAGYYPWHVNIFEDGVRRCAGSIISTSVIITAASCFIRIKVETPNEKLSVRTSDASLYRVSSKSYHPHFDEDLNMYTGVGLLKLSKKIRLSITVRPICLTTIPSKDYPKTEIWGVGNSQNMSYVYHQPIDINPPHENQTCLIPYEVYCLRRAPTNCVSDNGSGIVFKIGKQWFLERVAIIFKQTEPNKSRCDMMSIFKASNPHYYDWIKNDMNID